MKKFLLPAFAVAAAVLTAAPRPSYTEDDFRRITAMSARVLERNHYSGAKMSQEFSARIFDNYVDALDPERLLLSEEDLKPFQEHRTRLGFQLKEGEYKVAFSIYAIYKVRFEEFRKFSRKFLSSPIDFSVKESYTFDRSKTPRPKTVKDLPAIWQKKLKHQFLIYKLMEASEKPQAQVAATSPAIAEKEKNNSKNGKSSDTTAAKAPAPVKTPSPAERILSRQRDMGNVISKRENIDILGILLNALASTYGAHSSYHAPKASEDFDIHMNLSLSGIGATLTSDNGYIKIVELVPGGPAARSGKIKINDRIVRVTQENGESTDLIDMPVSQAVSFIRGEKGTKVTLDLLSGEAGSTSRVVLTRDKINLEDSAAKGEVKSVTSPKTGKPVKVGVITLPSFYMNFDEASRGDANARRASTDVRKILERFKREKVDSVVIDLRRNGGGSLPDAITMAGLFLKGGPVVQVRNNRGRANVYSDDTPDSSVYDGPLVVLTSKMSASAAEIFSAALRDSRRAVMVGDSRTFGKSTVLNVEDLTPYNSLFNRINAGTLIFESAMFFRINGNSVQQLGVTPDILLPSLTEEMEVGEMFSDNHLPWDMTTPAKYTLFDAKLPEKIAILRANSAARIRKNPEYVNFMNQLKIYRRIRNRKTVSLNEAQRRREYAEEKAMLEKTDEAYGENNRKSSEKDHILEEAMNIAAELIAL